MRATSPYRSRFWILLLVGSSACADALMAGPDGDRLQTGSWGGEHVALTVTDVGAHVELDCAFGDISQPLMIDADGRMTVEGVYVQERGPVRVGEEPERQPALYSGRLNVDKLTFEVTLLESKQNIGAFTVVHGLPPRGLRRCR